MSSDIGLTDADRLRLGQLAENGIGAHSGEPDPEMVECRNCGHTWKYTGSRRMAQCSACRDATPIGNTRPGDITQRQCNAIREAARDGLQYDAIADMFTFVSGKRLANDHATGRCSHTNGVEAVGHRRQSTPDVSAAECDDLRKRYEHGESVTDLERATGRDEATVYRHVTGRCSHD